MNEWIIFWIDICHFWWKVPFFVYFRHYLDNFRALFLFDQYQRVPDYWIELSFELNQQNFFLNWIIFWIESWVKRYRIKYWMNHFLEKFKHWIESDRVSNTPNIRSGGGFSIKMPITSPTSCPLSSAHRVVAALRVSRDITTRRTPSITTGVSGWQWEALYFLRMRTS